MLLNLAKAGKCVYNRRRNFEEALFNAQIAFCEGKRGMVRFFWPGYVGAFGR
jgi:hypothetical protein